MLEHTKCFTCHHVAVATTEQARPHRVGGTPVSKEVNCRRRGRVRARSRACSSFRHQEGGQPTIAIGAGSAPANSMEEHGCPPSPSPPVQRAPSVAVCRARERPRHLADVTVRHAVIPRPRGRDAAGAQTTTSVSISALLGRAAPQTRSSGRIVRFVGGVGG